ncbi:hypothetical protein V2J09_013976 [Rumex salicifolius]
MQPGGSAQKAQGAGGHGRSPASAAASPTSSSSAASIPNMGFDMIQQQQLHQQQQQQLHQQQQQQQQLHQQQQQQLHQQHQQLGARQTFQHQQLRRQEGNEAFLGFQAGGPSGLMGGDNFASSSGSAQSSQQPKKFFDSSQQQGSPQLREDGQSKGHGPHGLGQQALNPVHQAYLQYAFQASQQKAALGMQSQQQTKLEMDPVPMQAADQGQPSLVKKTPEPSSHDEKQMPHINPNSTNNMRPMQVPQPQEGSHNVSQNPMAMAAQLQAWALERNIDLTQPANANLLAQLIPLMQSRMMMPQKTNDSNSQASLASVQRQQVASPVASESSPRTNSSTEVPGQPGSSRARQVFSPGPFGSTSNTAANHHGGNLPMQQFPGQRRDSQGPSGQLSSIQTQKSQVNLNQGLDQHGRNMMTGQESLQVQHLKHVNQTTHSANGPSDGVSGNHNLSQAGPATPVPPQRTGFSKQQMHVLKAQILAFRRIKKGETTLPPELLLAITPPSLEADFIPASISDDASGRRIGDENARHAEFNDGDSQPIPIPTRQSYSKEEAIMGDHKANVLTTHSSGGTTVMREPPSMIHSGKEDQKALVLPVKPEPEAEAGAQKSLSRDDSATDRGKAIALPASASETEQLSKPLQMGTTPQTKDVGHTRKYHGPLFDFPIFTRKHDSLGSSMMANGSSNLTLAYDVKNILHDGGNEVINRRREENLKKIGSLLAVNLERKRIRPDLVLRLQIEEKKLKLLGLQAHLRGKIDQEQQEIMGMTDREYRKFGKLCERQRLELSRQVQASQRAFREKQLKSIFQWRKKLLEAHWAIRDARTARNRGVAKYHERMLREFSKRKDDDRNKRMEALKNNDMDRYREMLLEKQTSIAGDGAERYAVLSTFLTQTEEYLHKLGSKITTSKCQQEVEETAAAAAAAAHEIKAAAACAGEEVMIRNQFSEMNAPKDGSSVNKYYTLAHAVNEKVSRQPSMLRAGTLREYQLVGLQWMLSLYNNKLNGILADEMGLGKTVMALIAYLMEFKGNYGPHLIIVPNAVLVNWKSELHTWLPSVSCIYYVGNKEQRYRLFSQEVCALKFNVLVTTYEFIMFDRSKLSKVDWKYIIIDEAQRMKDRESVLARDLDRYRCQRRLLLTGTPLQNDLKELWSLLNLLLPEVFDNRKAFHDWFSQPFQKEGPTHNAEDDWLETEKKVIIIHRLHQILEPFMLRRRVEDVEGSLPPKVSFVLKCKMSPMQGAIYDWIKSTGTIRVDPEDEERRIQKSSLYQARVYRTLNNRCMELRKVCNHPLLNYPYYSNFSKDFLVRSCGKLWILDRILIKLQRTGHRVLLFSTMTKLLDILEEYLQWRRLIYRRIDGTTTLEDRESAIVDFNSPGTDCFIFLLSIRAAGRGLNLQSADTVIIYDPDPNPKNEEQAVARAHRIGQTREVRVLYMEAVVDKISSHQNTDEHRSGGLVDSEDDLAGKDRYIGSIESLIRNNIQQYKIDMADEVINAGRFDQRTTHEERRLTLETMLHDEERYQETVHDVPSLQEVNRMIARGDEELELFDQMDEEFDWAEDMVRYNEVPKWLQASTKEVNATVAALSKKPFKSKDIFTNTAPMESDPGTERRGRRKGKKPVYTELDDEIGDSSDASSEERNGDEEGEMKEFEDEEEGTPAVDKDQSEEDGPVLAKEEPGSSSDSQRLLHRASPPSPSKKFTSLSALDARPSSLSNRQPDDLEEGEIAASGDSQMDVQQSGSWNHEHEEGEDEQVVQPKIKRKRSIRLRPRPVGERQDDVPVNERLSLIRGDSPQFPFQAEPLKQEKNESPAKNRRSMPTRAGSVSKVQASAKLTRMNSLPTPSEDPEDDSRGSGDGKANSASTNSNSGARMSEIIQRRCKNVLNKLQKKIVKEGPQIVPMLTDLWKTGTGNRLLDLRKIDKRVDGFEYRGVMDFVSDIQTMLKSGVQYYGFSYEVRIEARKVHDLFFDILKIAFPDTDFREAKNSVSFSGPTSSASGSAPIRLSIPGRHKLVNEVERETNVSPRLSPRGLNEDTRGRAQKESRLAEGNNRDQDQDQDESPHPGELVVCKKKRKDRDNSAVKTRPGPVSPPSVGRSLRGPQSSSIGAQREAQLGVDGPSVGWANPVKRLRTDAGKRRPSHQ